MANVSQRMAHHMQWWTTRTLLQVHSFRVGGLHNYQNMGYLKRRSLRATLNVKISKDEEQLESRTTSHLLEAIPKDMRVAVAQKYNGNLTLRDLLLEIHVKFLPTTDEQRDATLRMLEDPKGRKGGSLISSMERWKQTYDMLDDAGVITDQRRMWNGLLRLIQRMGKPTTVQHLREAVAHETNAGNLANPHV
eukprot:Selendium_serpulae@DN5158_c0_g2_i3.p1